MHLSLQFPGVQVRNSLRTFMVKIISQPLIDWQLLLTIIQEYHNKELTKDVNLKNTPTSIPVFLEALQNFSRLPKFRNHLLEFVSITLIMDAPQEVLNYFLSPGHLKFLHKFNLSIFNGTLADYQKTFSIASTLFAYAEDIVYDYLNEILAEFQIYNIDLWRKEMIDNHKFLLKPKYEN